MLGSILHLVLIGVIRDRKALLPSGKQDSLPRGRLCRPCLRRVRIEQAMCKEGIQIFRARKMTLTAIFKDAERATRAVHEDTIMMRVWFLRGKGLSEQSRK